MKVIKNKFAGKCSICQKKLNEGEGFAANNGGRWFKVCNSSVCLKKSNIEIKDHFDNTRKLTEDGRVIFPFDRELIPLVKSLPGARWNPDNKVWTCSTDPKDLARVIEIAEQLQLEIPDSLKEKEKEGTPEGRKAEERAKNLIGKGGKKLFNFQIEGVKFLAMHDEVLLADDMGLGKSCQAIAALPEKAAVIIICPSSLKYNWQDEVNIWRPEFETIVCKGRDSFQIPESGQIVIINYEILPEWLMPTKKNGKKTQSGKDIKEADINKNTKEKLSKCIVIEDECQKSKNYKTKIAKKINQLTQHCKTRWLLTGTPIMNRPMDLYGILSAGNIRGLGSFSTFLRLFNGYPGSFGGYEFGMPSPEAPERLKRFMLRRLKKDVLKDLPPKIYKDINVDTIDKNLKKYLDDFIIKAAKDNELTKNKKKYTDDEISELANEVINLPSFDEFAKIRATLAESKIDSMLEIVETFEESDTPLVVFSAHKKPIEALGNRDGWKYITGDTESKLRRDIVKEFQEGKLKGIGVSIKAGGVGLTLTYASNALFVDLDWTPSLNLQAEDRLCRIGAVGDNIMIMRLVTNHSLDIHIKNLLAYKMELAYKAIDANMKVKPIIYKDIEIIEETEEEQLQRIKEATTTAEREYYLDKIDSIFDREAKKVEHLIEPELSQDRKDLLREAMYFMIGRCDGAQKRDGVGFNKPDAFIGHWIFRTGLLDSDDKSFRLLERVLIRYKKQLSDFNIWD